jgi:hypothetical protein
VSHTEIGQETNIYSKILQKPWHVNGQLQNKRGSSGHENSKVDSLGDIRKTGGRLKKGRVETTVK